MRGIVGRFSRLGSAARASISQVRALPPGHLFRLRVSNNGLDAVNDIDVAPGNARDEADTADLALTAAVGKQLDVSWAPGGTPGAPAGGLSSSLTITNTTYHVHLIRVSGVDEIGFDTSPVAANLITDHGATKFRRISSIMRESGVVVPFIQTGDYFRRTTPVLDVSDTNPGTAAVTRTLRVPTGIVVFAEVNIHNGAGVQHHTYLSPLDSTDMASSISVAPLSQIGQNIGATSNSSSGWTIVKTNTSAQIRSRSGVDCALKLSSLGYTDRRGRDG